LSIVGYGWTERVETRDINPGNIEQEPGWILSRTQSVYDLADNQAPPPSPDRQWRRLGCFCGAQCLPAFCLSAAQQ